MRLLTAIAVSSFLFASTAGAATYYVATTGNDAASGSIDAPFRTIKQATRVVRPGDIVNVRGGVYYESTHSYQVKGTESARIVIRSMPGEQAILDGSKLAAGTAIINLNENDYVDFSGFEVRNGPYIGIMVWHGRNVRVLDNHVHHMTRYAIYSGGETTPASYDITISGNQVHDSALENQYHATGGGWPGAVVVSRTERATITNNKIWNNDGEGLIWGRGNYATIRGNEIFDNFSVNLYINNARFGVVERNLVYSTSNSRYYRDGKPAAGIGIANEIYDVAPSSDNVITNNIVAGTRWGFYYGAFDAGGGLRNTKVLHNTFYGTTDEIVRVENDTHANSTIANNIFYQTGSPAPKYSGSGPVSYRNNLWYGGTAGVAAGAGDLFGDPLLVNPGGRAAGDYKLRPLSPAIHTALDLSGVAELTTDFFGQPRTPTYDIGAHEQSVSTGSSAPATPALLPPANVDARLASAGRVRVTWTAAAGALRYDVYRNGRYLDTVETNALFDESVAPATAYTYEVSSRDGNGNESARSMPASITTPAERATPRAPSGVQAIAASSRVDLSWPAVTGAASYAVLRGGVQIAVTSAPSHRDATVASSTTYEYQIVAVAADGTRSPASETIRVTTTGSARHRAVTASFASLITDRADRGRQPRDRDATVASSTMRRRAGLCLAACAARREASIEIRITRVPRSCRRQSAVRAIDRHAGREAHRSAGGAGARGTAGAVAVPLRGRAAVLQLRELFSGSAGSAEAQRERLRRRLSRDVDASEQYARRLRPPLRAALLRRRQRDVVYRPDRHLEVRQRALVRHRRRSHAQRLLV